MLLDRLSRQQRLRHVKALLPPIERKAGSGGLGLHHSLHLLDGLVHHRLKPRLAAAAGITQQFLPGHLHRPEQFESHAVSRLRIALNMRRATSGLFMA